VADCGFNVADDRRRALTRRAFTLIEILLALTITLIMMGAVVTLFGVMTDSVSASRALIEASDRLRVCRNRLQADMQGATATMKPPRRPESDEGYFEIGEGVNTDGNNGFTSLTPPPAGATLFGDTDDYLAFTTRSKAEPFVGKYRIPGPPVQDITAESQSAEVVYFLAQSGSEAILDPSQAAPTRLYTLYRRSLIVIQQLPSGILNDATSAFYDTNDISARIAGANRVPNTMGDLTKPENRFNHVGVSSPPAFPFRMSLPMTGFIGPRLGDDILMTNVLAFDVQVYDPGAPVFISGGVAVEPRDSGYLAQYGGSPLTYGAYADLAYGITKTYTPASGAPVPLFNLAPAAKSGIPSTRSPTNPYAYDTWSLHYENDGIKQMGAGADQLGNGLDDNGDNVVDDLGEADTLPPYAGQLRGVRITVRIYEPSSRQTRQITVIQDFLPD
jgi:prepilin-type N-terminal cleavage/methylation domain-containing protein